MRLIDADAIITAMSYDDEHEVTRIVRMNIADFLDSHTVEGCPKNDRWINVKDRLPVETHSLFYRFYGTQMWTNAMWREQSDRVLVTVAFKDGSKRVTTGATHDGVWYTPISRELEPVVTHWQVMPEPPKEENDNEDAQS